MIEKRGLDCNNLVGGLIREDCEHMSNIGFGSQGKNDFYNNGIIWIGDDGPNKFTYTNRADEGGPASIIVVIWWANDDASSFVSSRQPYITYSLPNQGDHVTISVANGISGAFAALNHRITILRNGQVFNTWGEFTTGNSATIDVSRLPNMGGNRMEIYTGGGCNANMDRCVFKCKSGNTCWERDTYYLQNCDANSQPGDPHSGLAWGQPSGGCGGFSNGGNVWVDLHN